MGEETVVVADSTTGGAEVHTNGAAVKSESNGNGTTQVKQELSELDQAIIKQVEFYFGDYNLPRDNFLKEQTQIDEGWVPMETMLKFNRLNKLSNDSKVITSALKKSQNDLVHVHEDDSKIRRNPDKTLKILNFKDLNSRTLYMKGFPVESTTDDVLKFFNDKKIPYDSVHMRREKHDKDRKDQFKGSIFVVFKSDREAMDFLSKVQNGEKVVYDDGTVLEVCSKEEHYAKKAVEKSSGKGGNNRDQQQKDRQNKPAQAEFDYEKCGILKLSEVKAESSRESLKTVFKPFVTDNLFISFDKGSTTGFLRFVDKETAEKALNGANDNGAKKLATPEGEFEAVLLTEETEERKGAIEQLKKDEEFLKSRQQNRNNDRRGGGNHRGGRGGRGGGRGSGNWNRSNKRDHQNKGSRDGGDGPQAKHSKFDSDNE